MSARVAPNFDAFGASGLGEVPSFPGGSRFLQLRPQYKAWVAPRPVSPALPAMDRRVASILTSFGGASCESPELPRCFARPVSPTISIQVAPDAYPPAPADGMSESPRIAHHPVRLNRASELPRFFEFGYDVRPISRLP
jgi:hypothetical protein